MNVAPPVKRQAAGIGCQVRERAEGCARTLSVIDAWLVVMLEPEGKTSDAPLDDVPRAAGECRAGQLGDRVAHVESKSSVPESTSTVPELKSGDPNIGRAAAGRLGESAVVVHLAGRARHCRRHHRCRRCRSY